LKIDVTKKKEPEEDLVVVTRREKRRVRTTKRRLATAGLLVPVMLVGLIAGITRIGHRNGNGAAGDGLGAGPEAVTYLVMTVQGGDISRQADTLTVFSIGGGQQPYVLLIPSSTLTEIPGYGFDSAGRALSFGRVPLADVTVENMLGARIDHTAVIDDAAFARFVDRIGGIRVNVPSNLFQSDGHGTLLPVFGAGEQSMSGKRAVRYLTYLGPDETELSRLAREQQVWEAIFKRFEHGKAGELASGIGSLGRALDGDAGATAFGRFLAAFATVSASARTYDVLPVTPVGGGDQDESFRINQGELQTQVARFMPGSLSAPAPRTRLQLLNGNGMPEVGISVAEKLIPSGFELVDSGNARSFGFAKTKIIVYASDAATMSIAERVKQLLGLGQIVVARRGQTSIDVTIVIGKDYKAA
jgi:LCP family protein required for cell wall assembly